MSDIIKMTAGRIKSDWLQSVSGTYLLFGVPGNFKKCNRLKANYSNLRLIAILYIYIYIYAYMHVYMCISMCL
jgi:hypothetical protein